MLYFVWAAIIILTWFSYLAQILGFWVTCGVKMMSLCHGWGWQPSQTTSHIKCLSTMIFCPWAYIISLTQLYPTYLAQILGFWVTCGVKMMSLCTGWGWRPPQTASCIHTKHIKSVRAHWYAVHWHTVAALHGYTHPTWLRFWGFWVTCEVKMIS
jgi:hypothetical protein